MVCGDCKMVGSKSHHEALCGFCWAKVTIVVFFGRMRKGEDYNWQAWPAPQIEDLKQRSLSARAAYQPPAK